MNYARGPEHREAALRSIRFERPAFIPMAFVINDACYAAYDADALNELIDTHPLLFPDGVRRPSGFAPNARANQPYKDDFGCTWFTAVDGIVGTVLKHPLEDWAAYDTYRLPDPETSYGLCPIHWPTFERERAEERARGELTVATLRHGHTFLQLCDLRGYENLLFDMMDEEPLLDDLLEKLTVFNLRQIEHFLAAEVDMVGIPEDLGMQRGPMLGVEQFRRYILPAYRRLIEPARRAGCLVHMHSDGDIRLLADDLMMDGVDVLNLQDLVNGIDWIGARYRGRRCIELDVDRQSVTPFGTPKEIDALIRREVETIGCREGGLMMIYGLYPCVPLANVKAVMDAMERYATLYQ